jgi:DNA polymerase III subunit delta'
MSDGPNFHDALEDIAAPNQLATQLVAHKAQLENIVASHRAGRLHHATILAGPIGIGKASLAFQAAALIFESEGDAFAREKIAAGSHSALLHLTRGWNSDTGRFRQEITIDDVRRVGRLTGSTAATGGSRIIVVDAADDLNRNAANALLKNLEEPPQKTFYFLITQNLGSLLPTIRSRCRVVNLPTLSIDEVQDVLVQLGVHSPSSTEIAAISGGSVRQAITLEREGGLDISQALQTLFASQVLKSSDVSALASLATAKDAASRYSFIMDSVEQIIAERAKSDVKSLPAKATQLAELHASIRERRAIVDAYNLDRNLEVTVALATVHAKLHA